MLTLTPDELTDLTGYRQPAKQLACAAAGIEDLNLHDLRGRAGVDVLESDGLEAARALLGHKTQGMTAHYTSNKSVAKVKPSR